jgi:hypothetical protein
MKNFCRSADSAGQHGPTKLSLGKDNEFIGKRIN